MKSHRDDGRVWQFAPATKQYRCCKCGGQIPRYDLVARSGRRYMCCDCFDGKEKS